MRKKFIITVLALLVFAVPALADTGKPIRVTAPVITGVLSQGQVVTTDNGTWGNSPTLFTYRWQRCDRSGRCAYITGATSASYTLTADDMGHNMRSVVTARNDNGPTTAVSHPTAAVQRAVKTVISLTFDDGNLDQYVQAAPMLKAHGMAGTFYINSPLVGTTGKMSWDQVHQLASDGNEIAGHTLSHVDLTTLSTADATTEVCQDRQNFIAQGITPTDFAYPFGAYNATVESIVKGCGYDSARVIANLENQTTCTSCSPANDIPPVDPYGIFTNSSIQNTAPLSTIEWNVTNAESKGGGWVPLVFHHISTDPADAPFSIDPVTLNAFLDWLKPRVAQGTVVETVHQVMGSPAPTPGPNLIQNDSLETRTSGTLPDNYQTLSQNNGGAWGYSWVTSPVHSGLHAEQVNVTNMGTSAGPQVFTTQAADTTHAPSVLPGHFYKASIWYQADAGVFMNVYYHNSSGWHFMQSSAPLPASASWTQARFLTSAVPSGADHLSIGLQMKGAGTMTVDDFYLFDAT